IFIWADFTKFLPSHNSTELFAKFCDEPYKIIPSPGDSFFGSPGAMRFCYMWMPNPQQACQELIRRFDLSAGTPPQGGKLSTAAVECTGLCIEDACIPPPRSSVCLAAAQICPVAAAAFTVSPVLYPFTMTTVLSIIGLERFSAALFALSVLLTAILAGLDFAVTEAILGLSLVAVQRMFVQSATGEVPVDARSTPAELLAVCPRPRVSRPKKRGKTVGLEAVGVTCAGIEPATSSVACLPERVDRSVGTEDLPGLYECVDPVPTKQLSRAARRRQRRRERLHAATELSHTTEASRGSRGALDGERPSKVDEGYAPTPSTDLSLEEGEPSECHARLTEVDA
ncbi:hypothetical protein FOZ63_011720, partial [Perkinsus olseni]